MFVLPCAHDNEPRKRYATTTILLPKLAVQASNPVRQQVMPDDHSELVPPLPIPNRTVKRLHADDSAGSRVKVGNRQAVTPQKALLNRAGLFALQRRQKLQRIALRATPPPCHRSGCAAAARPNPSIRNPVTPSPSLRPRGPGSVANSSLLESSPRSSPGRSEARPGEP